MRFMQRAGRDAGARVPPPGLPFWQLFAVHALLDEEGRPLGEHRAPRDLPGAAPTRLKQCRYAGSRYNHPLPMNVSALRQTSHHWDDIVAGIGFLHEGFRDGAAPLTLAGLWRLLVGVAVLPAYLRHRVRTHEWVPEAFVAAMYKASLGIKFLLEAYLLQELLAGRSVERPADAQELAALSESSGDLVGAQQVCAAPASMIADTLRCFVEGVGRDAARRSRLATLVVPWERFRDFARAACELHVTLLAFSTIGARIQLALEKELAGRCNTAGLAAVESSPLEVSLSLTLGMRRLRWPLARLESEGRCSALLQAFGRFAFDEVAGNTVDLLYALDGQQAKDRREARTGDLQRLLSAQTDGGSRLTDGAAICRLIARYLDLENAVRVRVRDLERRLNEALGRARPDGDPAPMLEHYCAVSPCEFANAALGVQVAWRDAPPPASVGRSLNVLRLRVPLAD